MDPNSQNQIWTEWTFEIYETGRHVPHADVEHNFRKWVVVGFGHAGATSVRQTVKGWVLKTVIEGTPPDTRQVSTQFQRRFVEAGWGPLAFSSVECRLLAGPVDGKPRSQWLSIPTIPLDKDELM